MKKRHLVIPELKQLEKEFHHKNTRMAGIIHQICQLIDENTTLDHSQLTEVLHLLELEVESKRTIVKVVTQIATLINGLYLTHLIAGTK